LFADTKLRKLWRNGIPYLWGFKAEKGLMGRTGANRSGGTDESHLALKDMVESWQTTCSTRPNSEKMDFA